MQGKVVSVSLSPTHTLSKACVKCIQLIENHGVKGDAHAGVFVKHRSRIKKNPTAPNLRQVHLIHSELFEELAERGHRILPGQMGENITTQKIDLLALPEGTLLKIGDSTIRITGLRNPCTQLNQLSDGLMNDLVGKNELGEIVRKAGIMGVVEKSGSVTAGNFIDIELPNKPYKPLDRV